MCLKSCMVLWDVGKKNKFNLLNITIMGLLTGKTAIVTGAARGIGKAIAM